MTRFAELQKKYPNVHPDIILKCDVNCMGVRDSKDLDEVSFWKPASQGSYLSYDEDLTLERLKAETPWRVREDAVLTPNSLMTKTGNGIHLWRKEHSPYTVRKIGDDKFALFEGEEKVDVDLYPTPKPAELCTDLKTSNGTPIQDLVRLNRRCYTVIPVRFCEYFTSGDECKFCNFNPTQEDARRAGFNRPVTIDPGETGEAFKIYGSQVRLIEGFVENGGFKKTETEASVHLKFMEAMSKALPYRTHLKLNGEALPRAELLRLRDVGMSSLLIHMEIFDERLFPIMVPGKAKHMSREGWLESFQDAVDIFGWGNVGAKFVGGLGVLGPEGYTDWRDARDSMAEGNRWCISHGALPLFTALRWAPGSPYSKDPANRKKFPPTEFYIDLVIHDDKVYKEYGMYDKMNKFVWCGLDCGHGLFSCDIGVIERAGDWGTWMSDRVPDEGNWIKQALDSIKTKEGMRTK